MTNLQRALTERDLEIIERFIYKSTGDLASAIGRGFERLEERIDAAEARIYGRLAELEDRIEGTRQSVADQLDDIKAQMLDLARSLEHTDHD